MPPAMDIFLKLESKEIWEISIRESILYFWKIEMLNIVPKFLRHIFMASWYSSGKVPKLNLHKVLAHFSPVLHFIQKPVIWSAQQINWMISIWNATLGWTVLIWCLNRHISIFCRLHLLCVSTETPLTKMESIAGENNPVKELYFSRKYYKPEWRTRIKVPVICLKRRKEVLQCCNILSHCCRNIQDTLSGPRQFLAIKNLFKMMNKCLLFSLKGTVMQVI